MGGCRPAFGSAWDSWIIPPGLPPDLANALNNLKGTLAENENYSIFYPDYIIYKGKDGITYAFPSKQSGLPFLQATDDSYLINAAIDAAIIYKDDTVINATIYLCGGTYNITDTIVLFDKITLIGNLYEETILKWAGGDDNTKSVCYLNNSHLATDGNYYYEVTAIMKNIKIESSNTLKAAIETDINSTLFIDKMKIDMGGGAKGLSIIQTKLVLKDSVIDYVTTMLEIDSCSRILIDNLIAGENSIGICFHFIAQGDDLLRIKNSKFQNFTDFIKVSN